MSAGRTRHLWSSPRPSRPSRPAGPTTPDASGGADPRARLTELHEASYADLLRFVQRRLPGPEAEDVVAATFETAWARVDEVPADARPWLFGVARNVMANHHRAAARRSGLAVRLAAATTADADVRSDDHEGVGARIDLVRAWRTLAEADQEVLSLVAFDGLRGEQAAQVLGITRSAFAMRLQRARQRLAGALRADPADSAHVPDSRRGAGGGPSASSTDPASDPASDPPRAATRAPGDRRAHTAASLDHLQEMTWPST